MAKLLEINDKPPEFMQALKKFLSNPKGFLLLSGNNGNGKTFSAKAIYEHFWHPHTDNEWWNQAKLNMKWLELTHEHGHTNYFLEKLIKAPLLVLDDIGTRKPTAAFGDFLYWIVDHRYENCDKLGTIITTNLNSASMAEMFGDAFLSRVISGIYVRHDGPDRREEKNS